MNRPLRLIGSIMVMILVVLVVGFFLSTTIINDIKVSGHEHYTRREILDIAELSDKDSVLDVLLHRKTVVENHGYINRLEVKKVDLKTVEIHVAEKEVVGYVEYMGQYICLDREGYIIDYTSDLDEGKPKIQGIELESFTIEEPLDVSKEVIDSIQAIYSSSQAFGVAVEWIDFKLKDGRDIALTVGNLDVRIGDTSKLDMKFELLSEILKELPSHKKGILYLEDVENDIIFDEKK